MKNVSRLMLLPLALLALAASASAQSKSADLQQQLERVGQEFERTQALLERVAPMVRESNAPRPREIFARALEIQKQGAGQLSTARNSTDRPLFSSELARRALSMTLQARELAQRAGALLREQVGFEERARRAIDELERRIERARERDLANDTRDAALLAEAIEQAESARKHFADHNFEVAFRIADSALRLLDGVVGPGEAGRPGADRLRTELQRTRDLFERVRQNSDGFDERQQQQLERAGRLLGEARDAGQARDGRRAHRLLQEAQRILRQLMERGEATASDVERAMARVDAAMQRLSDRRAQLPSEALDLIERAGQERSTARTAFDAQEFDRALTHLRAAMDLLDRARRLGGRD